MRHRVKTILFGTVLGMLTLDVANAAAYSCYRPSELRIPSGYTLVKRDVETLRDDARRYLTDMQAYLDCLEREADHAVRELEAVGRDFERAAKQWQNQ